MSSNRPNKSCPDQPDPSVSGNTLRNTGGQQQPSGSHQNRPRKNRGKGRGSSWHVFDSNQLPPRNPPFHMSGFVNYDQQYNCQDFTCDWPNQGMFPLLPMGRGGHPGRSRGHHQHVAGGHHTSQPHVAPFYRRTNDEFPNDEYMTARLRYLEREKRLHEKNTGKSPGGKKQKKSKAKNGQAKVGYKMVTMSGKLVKGSSSACNTPSKKNASPSVRILRLTPKKGTGSSSGRGTAKKGTSVAMKVLLKKRIPEKSAEQLQEESRQNAMKDKANIIKRILKRAKPPATSHSSLCKLSQNRLKDPDQSMATRDASRPSVLRNFLGDIEFSSKDWQAIGSGGLTDTTDLVPGEEQDSELEIIEGDRESVLEPEVISIPDGLESSDEEDDDDEQHAGEGDDNEEENGGQPESVEEESSEDDGDEAQVGKYATEDVITVLSPSRKEEMARNEPEKPSSEDSTEAVADSPVDKAAERASPARAGATECRNAGCVESVCHRLKDRPAFGSGGDRRDLSKRDEQKSFNRNHPGISPFPRVVLRRIHVPALSDDALGPGTCVGTVAASSATQLVSKSGTVTYATAARNATPGNSGSPQSLCVSPSPNTLTERHLGIDVGQFALPGSSHMPAVGMSPPHGNPKRKRRVSDTLSPPGPSPLISRLTKRIRSSSECSVLADEPVTTTQPGDRPLFRRLLRMDKESLRALVDDPTSTRSRHMVVQLMRAHRSQVVRRMEQARFSAVSGGGGTASPQRPTEEELPPEVLTDLRRMLDAEAARRPVCPVSPLPAGLLAASRIRSSPLTNRMAPPERSSSTDTALSRVSTSKRRETPASYTQTRTTVSASQSSTVRISTLPSPPRPLTTLSSSAAASSAASTAPSSTAGSDEVTVISTVTAASAVPRTTISASSGAASVQERVRSSFAALSGNASAGVSCSYGQSRSPPPVVNIAPVSVRGKAVRPAGEGFPGPGGVMQQPLRFRPGLGRGGLGRGGAAQARRTPWQCKNCYSQSWVNTCRIFRRNVTLIEKDVSSLTDRLAEQTPSWDTLLRLSMVESSIANQVDGMEQQIDILQGQMRRLRHLSRHLSSVRLKCMANGRDLNTDDYRVPPEIQQILRTMATTRPAPRSAEQRYWEMRDDAEERRDDEGDGEGRLYGESGEGGGRGGFGLRSGEYRRSFSDHAANENRMPCEASERISSEAEGARDSSLNMLPIPTLSEEPASAHPPSAGEPPTGFEPVQIKIERPDPPGARTSEEALPSQEVTSVTNQHLNEGEPSVKPEPGTSEPYVEDEREVGLASTLLRVRNESELNEMAAAFAPTFTPSTAPAEPEVRRDQPGITDTGSQPQPETGGGDTPTTPPVPADPAAPAVAYLGEITSNSELYQSLLALTNLSATNHVLLQSRPGSQEDGGFADARRESETTRDGEEPLVSVAQMATVKLETGEPECPVVLADSEANSRHASVDGSGSEAGAVDERSAERTRMESERNSDGDDGNKRRDADDVGKGTSGEQPVVSVQICGAGSRASKKHVRVVNSRSLTLAKELWTARPGRQSPLEPGLTKSQKRISTKGSARNWRPIAPKRTAGGGGLFATETLQNLDEIGPLRRYTIADLKENIVSIKVHGSSVYALTASMEISAHPIRQFTDQPARTKVCLCADIVPGERPRPTSMVIRMHNGILYVLVGDNSGWLRVVQMGGCRHGRVTEFLVGEKVGCLCLKDNRFFIGGRRFFAAFSFSSLLGTDPPRDDEDHPVPMRSWSLESPFLFWKTVSGDVAAFHPHEPRGSRGRHLSLLLVLVRGEKLQLRAQCNGQLLRQFGDPASANPCVLAVRSGFAIYSAQIPGGGSTATALCAVHLDSQRAMPLLLSKHVQRPLEPVTSICVNDHYLVMGHKDGSVRLMHTPQGSDVRSCGLVLRAAQLLRSSRASPLRTMVVQRVRACCDDGGSVGGAAGDQVVTGSNSGLLEVFAWPSLLDSGDEYGTASAVSSSLPAPAAAGSSAEPATLQRSHNTDSSRIADGENTMSDLNVAQNEPTIGGAQGELTTGSAQGEPTTGGAQGEPTTGGARGEPTTGGAQGEPTICDTRVKPTADERRATLSICAKNSCYGTGHDLTNTQGTPQQGLTETGGGSTG